MSNSEMVLVPRALLGAVANALETGNPATKTLASVRELYLSDDFPDNKDMQEAGKYTSGADWAQEANGIDLESADFSDALMWLKEGKRVCRPGWNAGGQWAAMQVAQQDQLIGFEGDSKLYRRGDGLILKNAQGIIVQWIPSVGDLLATDWQVYEGQSAFVNKTAQVPLSSELAKLEADIPPHHLRLLEELSQLSDHLDKLTAFFDTDVYRSLDVDERGRLKEQCALMGELHRVLTERVRVAAF